VNERERECVDAAVYIGDYIRDTGHLTTTEHGADLLLLMHAWTRGGDLPNDDLRLRTIARMDAREWKRSGAVLWEFFQVDGDVLRYKRIDRELANAEAVVEQRRAAGRASGLASAARPAIRSGMRRMPTLNSPWSAWEWLTGGEVEICGPNAERRPCAGGFYLDGVARDVCDAAGIDGYSGGIASFFARAWGRHFGRGAAVCRNVKQHAGPDAEFMAAPC
jgi:uncharacterized protein YdaU (DUF1376 family)